MLEGILIYGTLLLLLVASGVTSLVRASRRFTRTDWHGIAALGVLTCVAAAFHCWISFKHAAICDTASKRVIGTPGAGWIVFDSVLRAAVAPLAATLIRQKGGRWHQAFVAATLVAFFPPAGVDGFELPWLLIGLVGGAEFRRRRQWNSAVLAVIGFAFAALFSLGAREVSPWPMIVLVVIVSMRLLPGRDSTVGLWVGRTIGVALVLAVVPIAFVHMFQDLNRRELFTHRMHTVMIRDVPECAESF